MNRWQALRHLNWPRFLPVFLFADVSTLVIPAWALGLRLAGSPGDSPALENLRDLSAGARQELQELLDDASSRAEPKPGQTDEQSSDRNALGSGRR